jgi:pilus assembly protein Flp/PilA
MTGVPGKRKPHMLKVYCFVRSHLETLRRDEKGVSALEYGVIAAAIIVAIATVLTTLGTSIRETFQTVADVLGP